MPTLTPADFSRLVHEANAAFPTEETFRLALPDAIQSYARNNLAIGQDKLGHISATLRYAHDNGHISITIASLYNNTSSWNLLNLIESFNWFTTDQRARLRGHTDSLVVGYNVMVNRDYLRDKVFNFAASASPRRVLVIPPSGSPGKSHSASLIAHVASQMDINYRLIDCLATKTVPPVETATIIANVLGVYDGTLAEQLKDASRPGHVFVTWLSGKLRDRPNARRSWIVFDHVGRIDPGSPVVGFANELANEAIEGNFRNLLVTLIDYDLPPRGFAALNPIFKDRQLTALSRVEVRGFIGRWATQKGRPLTDSELDDDVAACFVGFNEPLSRDDTRRLIKERISELLERRGLIA